MTIDIHTHHYRPDSPQVQVLNLRLPPDFSAALMPPPADNLRLSAGIHPWDAALFSPSPQLRGRLMTLCRDERIVYVGEIGLDKSCRASLPAQMELFRLQLSVADELKKPVILHCVRAMQEIIALKADYPSVPEWIVHGFRGHALQARQWLSKGFHLSFGVRYDPEAFAVCPPACRYRETDEESMKEEVALR